MKRIAFFATFLVALTLAIWAGGGKQADAASAGGKFQSRPIKILSIWDETDPNTNGWLLSELSKEYAKTVNGFSLDYEFVNITQLDQKVSVLLANNDLPDVTVYESGNRLKAVIQSGQIIDLDAAFKEMGIRDYLDAGAVSLLTNLVDGAGLYDLPLGLNMEGFWYNKALFAKAGITAPPKTWNEFLAVCEKLKQAGIVPIVQGGKDRWPVTRVLNAILVRSVGLNAVKDAVDGKAKFTDPQYVAAAQIFTDMAKKGYFVQGMSTIDPSTASAMLLNGQAAIKYDGSWFTSNINQARDIVGEDGIGFFNVPLFDNVPAGGTLDDYSMNCGNILMISKTKYDDALKDWMKFVFTRIGDFSIQQQASFKGYKITNMPASLPYYTKLTGDVLTNAKGSFLWFEAKMDSRTSEVAQNNIALLYSGEMTPQQYMAALQASLQ